MKLQNAIIALVLSLSACTKKTTVHDSKAGRPEASPTAANQVPGGPANDNVPVQVKVTPPSGSPDTPQNGSSDTPLLTLAAEVTSLEGFFLPNIPSFDLAIGGSLAEKARLEIVEAESTCPGWFGVEGTHVVHRSLNVRGPKECLVMVRAAAGEVVTPTIKLRAMLLGKDLEIEVSKEEQTPAKPELFVPIAVKINNVIDEREAVILLQDESCPGFFVIDGRNVKADFSKAASAGLCSANVVAKEGDALSKPLPVRVIIAPLVVKAERTAQDGYSLKEIKAFDLSVSGTLAAEAKTEITEQSCTGLAPDRAMFYVENNRVLPRAEDLLGPRECVVKVRAVNGSSASAVVELRVVLNRKELKIAVENGVQNLAIASDFVPIEVVVKDAVDAAAVVLAFADEGSCPGFFRIEGRKILADFSKLGANGTCTVDVVGKEGEASSAAIGLSVSVRSEFNIAAEPLNLTVSAGSSALLVKVRKVSGPEGDFSLVRAAVPNYSDPCVKFAIFKVERTSVTVAVPRDFPVGSLCAVRFHAEIGDKKSNELQLEVRVGEAEKRLADFCADANLSPDLRKGIENLRKVVSETMRRSGTLPYHVPLVDCERLEGELQMNGYWKNLNLANMEIKDLSLFRSLVKSKSLDASGNGMSSFAGLDSWKEMTVLRASGSARLSDTSAIQSLVKLRALYLDGTAVTDLLPLTSLVGLDTLDLSSTKIVDFSSLPRFPALKNLYLEGIPLAGNASFAQAIGRMTELESLSVRSCGLKEIPWAGQLSKLRFLNLEMNSLATIPANFVFADLRALFLAGNGVNLPPETVAGMKNLKMVSLKASAAPACPPGFSGTTEGSHRFCARDGW